MIFKISYQFLEAKSSHNMQVTKYLTIIIKCISQFFTLIYNPECQEPEILFACPESSFYIIYTMYDYMVFMYEKTLR